jgi:Uma2 family endonuclease
MVTQTQPNAPSEVFYPESDGKPMADNTKQFRWIVVIEQNLELLFADQPDVFVAGDLLWYPVEGNNALSTAPDTMVIFGRSKGDRGSYQQWNEGNIAPQVVFEILSPGNTAREMERKLLFYQTYGVQEYYLYDPDRIQLRGWQRSQIGLLEQIEPMSGWVSPRLEIRFELGEELQLFRPDGQAFFSFAEINHQLEQAKQRAEQEQGRAEQERERAEQERERANQERERAEQERERAEQERERADRLAEKLRELGIDPNVM